MKKTGIVISGIALMVAAWGCNSKNERGHEYMPDMGYSRAYETYTNYAELDSMGIHYNGTPVAGTIKRGSVLPFTIPVDKAGDSTNYNLSKQVPNPLPALNAPQMVEAERLYLINCGICHGMKLDGNGPLYNGGNGPYAAAPKNLVADPAILAMPDGQMFYSITYGKGQMGPYGPQLSTTQRWMIVHYIRNKQGKGGGAPGVAADSTAKNNTTQTNAPGAAADSAANR
jgi:mono/diheme cytochrome c family protein